MFCRTGRILFSATVFVLFICASLPARAQKISIKHAWPPGAYVLTRTSHAESDLLVGDQAVKSASRDTVIWDLHVGEFDERAEKRMTARVSAFKFSEDGEPPLSYDSEAPPSEQDPDSAFVYGPLIGAPVEILLDADDEVVDVTGLGALWADLLTKATTEDQREGVAEARAEFADRVVEHALRRMEIIVPWEPVAPGDRWVAGIRCDFPLVGQFRQRYDCALKNIEEGPAGKLAVFSVEARHQSNKPTTFKTRGRDVTVRQVEVIEKSDVTMNLSTGLPGVEDSTLHITATLETTDEDGKPLTIRTSGVNCTRTTLVPAGRPTP